MDHTFEVLKVSAEAGNAVAQYELGMKYVQEREDYIVNPDSAFYWLEAAATQGYLPAQKKLGELYFHYYILSPEYGWRVTRGDHEKSYKWWKAAADSEDAESIYHVGMFHKGFKELKKHNLEIKQLGIIASDMTASEHFRMAEKFYLQCIQCESPVWSGNAAAELANLYEECGNEYEEYDRPKAIRMYRRTIEMCQYVVSSDYPLKADYYETLGLLYDYFGESTEALKMYQCAIDSGSKVGPIYLKIAMVYEDDEDYTNAIAIYKKIIEGGDEMSSYCKELAEDNLKRLEDSI